MSRRTQAPQRGEQTTEASAEQVPGAHADSPAQIPARGWFQVLRRSFKQVGEDHLTLLAGGIAYTWFLALFPGIIAAVLIWGLVADPAQIQQQISDMTASLPSSAAALVTDQLTAATASAGKGGGLAVAVSVALALWSTSAGVAGLVEATNIAYNEKEERNFFLKRGLALLMTLGFLVFLLVAVALIVVFPIMLEQIAPGAFVEVVAQVVRWLLLLLVAVVALGLLYRVGPDRDPAQVRWLSLGAVIATVSLARGLAGLLVLRRQLQQLQPDLRQPGRCRGAAAVVLDHRPGGPARRRDQLRDRGPDHTRHHRRATQTTRGARRGQGRRDPHRPLSRRRSAGARGRRRCLVPIDL